MHVRTCAHMRNHHHARAHACVGSCACTASNSVGATWQLSSFPQIHALPCPVRAYIYQDQHALTCPHCPALCTHTSSRINVPLPVSVGVPPLPPTFHNGEEACSTSSNLADGHAAACGCGEAGRSASECGRAGTPRAGATGMHTELQGAPGLHASAFTGGQGHDEDSSNPFRGPPEEEEEQQQQHIAPTGNPFALGSPEGNPFLMPAQPELAHQQPDLLGDAGTTCVAPCMQPGEQQHVSTQPTCEPEVMPSGLHHSKHEGAGNPFLEPP